VGFSGTLSRISAKLGARLDAFVPPDRAAGTDEASRARVAAGVSFLMSIVRTGLAATQLLLGNFRPAAGHLLLATITLLAPFVMRRPGRYPYVLNVAIGTSVMVMGYSALSDRSRASTRRRSRSR